MRILNRSKHILNIKYLIDFKIDKIAFILITNNIVKINNNIINKIIINIFLAVAPWVLLNLKYFVLNWLFDRTKSLTQMHNVLTQPTYVLLDYYY